MRGRGSANRSGPVGLCNKESLQMAGRCMFVNINIYLNTDIHGHVFRANNMKQVKKNHRIAALKLSPETSSCNAPPSKSVVWKTSCVFGHLFSGPYIYIYLLYVRVHVYVDRVANNPKFPASNCFNASTTVTG